MPWDLLVVHYLVQLRRNPQLCCTSHPLPDPSMPSDDRPGLKSVPSSAPDLPFQHLLARGETVSVAGTNVVRVPFGVRRSRRERPARPETWATLVLPLQRPDPTPPPQAA